MKTCFLTDRGIRPRNEDACGVWKFPQGLTLIAVADGLGGHPAGDIASALALEELHRAVGRGLADSPDPDHGVLRIIMKKGFSSADNEVFSRGIATPAWQGMGTTLVAALIREEGHGILGNLGDSRAYSIGPEGAVRLSVDHSRVMEMVSRGILTLEEANRHPMKNIVTRIAGRPGDSPDLYDLRMNDEDLLMLCSDGLIDGLSDAEIAQISGTVPFSHLCEALVHDALRTSRDNVTVAAAKRETH
ncbi:protein phosphatase [Methanolinea mesophila]|uniref:PP2C family protein-serine/threonine phosphatase n=1 Tax=Methanolinea mesophila TaxID=547055 RepID=UPI001AEA32AC|nr:protein phosphatase 2C domain-containing protein [Methanolinea mesophila]MBP1927962.1 protein phosphatase [Methanolinea mesophila]